MSAPSTRANARTNLPLAREAISSVDGADLALAELGELDAIEARVNADCKRKCESIAADFAGRLFVEIEGERLAIADRRKELHERLELFCNANRSQLLADGDKKSRDLNHGTIGWRQSSGSIEPLEGMPAAGCAKILDAIVEACREILNKLKIFSVGTRPYVRVSVAFDKRALLTAAASGDVTKAELKKVGFRHVAGVDQFYAKPNAQDLKSQPTAAMGS